MVFGECECNVELVSQFSALAAALPESAHHLVSACPVAICSALFGTLSGSQWHHHDVLLSAHACEPVVVGAAGCSGCAGLAGCLSCTLVGGGEYLLQGCTQQCVVLTVFSTELCDSRVMMTCTSSQLCAHRDLPSWWQQALSGSACLRRLRHATAPAVERDGAGQHSSAFAFAHGNPAQQPRQLQQHNVYCFDCEDVFT